MSRKTTSMSKIKQMLLLLQASKGIKTIASITGISRNTIKSYKVRLDKMDASIDDLLLLDDPVLESVFHAGNPAYSDKRFDTLKLLLDDYIKELENPRNHLTRFTLWQEYRSEHPDGYGYSQFCFHLGQHQSASHPTMVLSSTPGDKLLVDFAGDTLSYVDIHTGEIITCQVFVACLQYTDYGFAMAVQSQTIDDFVYALTRCLHALGGVPVQVVPDNLKTAITRANPYEPTINQVLLDMANHYGFAVTPTRVRKPRDKALVEDQVKLIYHRVYARIRKQTFHSLSELNAAMKKHVIAHNQTRMQRYPHTREERFLSVEKPCLKPLPDTDFEIKYYVKMKVSTNNHIYLGRDKHYYSVPYQWIGWKVKVAYTHTMVWIYADGQQPVSHLRSFGPDPYTTNKDHLCSTHLHYLNRSPEYYINLAKRKTPVLGELFESLFKDSSRPPEQLYKSCEGILHLHRKTEIGLFERACHLAMAEQQLSYGFLKKVIANKALTNYGSALRAKPLPKHENIRGAEYYAKQLELHF
jgi:transposase